MTGRRFRPDARVLVRTLLAVLIGMLAGGAFNAALGERGADTPAMRAVSMAASAFGRITWTYAR